jgi:phosphoglycerate kinase
MERELEYLGRVLHGSERPFVVILGGAKIGDKLPLIAHLVPRADHLLIGGGMAYTFLKAQGKPIGGSLLQADFVAAAKELLHEFGGKFVLPTDHVLEDATVVQEIPEAAKALDIGPATRDAFARIIAGARMVFWNGPMGMFEKSPFDQGTLAVARAVAASTGLTVAGGGDSVAALHASGLADRLSHVSTGGGASLEFLSGDTLPGVAALTEK